MQKLLAEWLGTFFLVFVATGAIVIDGVSHGQIGRASSVVAPGLVVMASVLFLSELSGAHLNPVVTVAFAIRGENMAPHRSALRVPRHVWAVFPYGGES